MIRHKMAMAMDYFAYFPLIFANKPDFTKR